MRVLPAVVLCVAAFAARAAPPSFLIESELAPTHVYVGAETILKVRLLRAPGVPYGVLPPPVLGDAAEVWPLGPVRWFQEPRDGVLWDLHERTYLIVPKRAGTLVVPGADIEGPLRGFVSGRDARSVLRGPQLRMEVRPPPANVPEPWLPARRLTIEESWSQDPSRLAAGTAVTRTLILRAEGLPAQRLPKLEMAAQPELRVHHDQPELATELRASGTVGRRIQRIVLVPLDEGEARLPALGIRWWDVEADAPREASLPARTLRFRPAAAPPAPPAVEPFVSDQIVRAIAIGTVLALIAWLAWRARSEPLRDARRQLRVACRANNAQAARAALTQWWNVRSRGAPEPLLQGIGAAWDPGARAQLRALDAAVYGRHLWDGREFWRRVRPWLAKRRSPRAAPEVRSTRFFKLQGTD